MDELFPRSAYHLVSESGLVQLLREQCARDLERSGFRLETEAGDLPSALVEKLAALFRDLSAQELARISYVSDIPDRILRATGRSDIPIETFAEAFVRRAALKVVTRLTYSRK